MMKKVLIILAAVACLTMFAACKKEEECYFCGEQRVCKKGMLDGEKVAFCEECENFINEIKS